MGRAWAGAETLEAVTTVQVTEDGGSRPVRTSQHTTHGCDVDALLSCGSQGGRGQLKCRKALGLIWNSIPAEEGAPFSAQRFCPSINRAGDVFLNVTKAMP